MLRRFPRGLTVAVIVVFTLLLAVVATMSVRAWRESQRSDLARAVSMAPAETQRLSWTDWRAVRRSVGQDLGQRPSTEDVQAFLDAAFARDLSTSSALVASGPTLHEEFGFSPADLEWELLAQGPEGAVEILKFADDADFAELGQTLEALGFTRPDSRGGVWAGGPDVLSRIGPNLTPELQFFALLPDAGVVLTSDTRGYLEDAVDVARGESANLTSVDEVVADSGSPVNAAVFTGSYACEHLAMAGADQSDQDQADVLIEEAGGVHPLDAFAMARQPDGSVRVSMSFETEDAARSDADSRARLAGGAAPGQGGEFSDRFAIESATAQDRVVRLVLDPAPGQYVLSDLTSGPVLFASC